MTRNLSTRTSTRETVPALATPALPAGEDSAAYHDLADRIAAAVEPADVLEEIWVRDVVDLVWDVVRLRQFKAQLFTVAASDGMAEILYDLGEQYATKAHGWAARQPAHVAEVNRMLSAAGLVMGHVATSAFVTRIDQFERIERMLAAAEARRAAALAELDRRRAALAQRLRDATQAAERAIEDAEFEEVAPSAEAAAPGQPA
jgi:hypothetical protein